MQRVKIKCDDAIINLPIDPDTSASDLLYAAAQSLQRPVKPETSILLESFTKLGLERPLRKYEHIRDVMNSWDRDTQNGLILVPSATDGNDSDLEANCVPRDQPPDTSVYLYYSQKPGSWDKRWATLRSDGQILVAKKADSKERDINKICHLSDFDIYSPTKGQMKKIRPPKKQCFAIKSQQRSSMFLSTANFVHFFATDDKQVADQWYKAVQEWRSWYLVNKVGALQKTVHPTSHPIQGGPRRAPSKKGSLGGRRPSIDVKNPSHERGHSSTNMVPGQSTQTAHARNLSRREKKPPPLSFPTTLEAEPARTSVDEARRSKEPTFAPTGLLGRTYSQRQQLQREREIAGKQETPFTSGPSLLHGGVPPSDGPPLQAAPHHDRSISIRSRHEAPSGLKRNSSQRHPSKPLLDFSSPQHQEVPQHARKGRGLTPAQLPSGGLIDVATSPEVAIAIPPASTWRRPETRDSSAGVPGQFRSNTMSRSQSNPFADGGSGGDEAFTGLLARAGPSQGGSGRGKGVMTGDRHASGPMLNMSEPSQYAPGSLLDRVERQSGTEHGPIIDREKRTEMQVDVGEGLRRS